VEDGWETREVREGPTIEEQVEKIRARSESPKKGHVKKKDLDAAPKLDLLIPASKVVEEDEGWLG
jgi:hypothetical protein